MLLHERYANKRIAVDVSDWLHWGKHHVLKESGRVPTADDIVEACCDRVKLLLEHQAIPVLVFDGAAVPAKAETDARRRAQREEARQAADDLRAAGDLAAMNKKLTEALPVTHALALQLRQEVQSRWGDSVEHLVAPYEADAQLAALARRVAAVTVSRGGASVALRATEASGAGRGRCTRFAVAPSVLDSDGIVFSVHSRLRAAAAHSWQRSASGDAGSERNAAS